MAFESALLWANDVGGKENNIDVDIQDKFSIIAHDGKQ